MKKSHKKPVRKPPFVSVQKTAREVDLESLLRPFLEPTNPAARVHKQLWRALRDAYDLGYARGKRAAQRR